MRMEAEDRFWHELGPPTMSAFTPLLGPKLTSSGRINQALSLESCGRCSFIFPLHPPWLQTGLGPQQAVRDSPFVSAELSSRHVLVEFACPHG